MKIRGWLKQKGRTTSAPNLKTTASVNATKHTLATDRKLNADRYWLIPSNHLTYANLIGALTVG